MEQLQKLKSEAYDLLALIEEANRQLRAKNEEINNLAQVLQKGQAEAEKPESKSKEAKA